LTDTKRDRQMEYQAYVELYRKAHNGLSPAAIKYRRDHGWPLDLPLNATRKVKQIKIYRPGKCEIFRSSMGTPKADRCYFCCYPDYQFCLDFALSQGWKNWGRKEG
jgi:hypothetical protein